MNATRHLPSATTLARGLGWFSIALGAAELLMPRQVGRAAGLAGRETLLRSYGAREIATGIGLLVSRRPVWWMWARVAGDALDAATLSRGTRGRAGLSLGIVAAVAAADLACAAALSRPQGPRPLARDYSDRTGMPRSPAQMRGAARADFEMPRDMQSRPRVRPYRGDTDSASPEKRDEFAAPRWTSASE
jgi:hypothetical protein